MSDQVYVALVGEGVRVWRPVPAYPIGGGVFILERPDDYDPQIEEWEYPPGSRVVCEKRRTAEGEILAAVRAAQRRLIA
jgi:hypothetical protein